MAKSDHGGVMSKMVLLSLFGASLAFVEAVVTVYTRRIMPLGKWQAEVNDSTSLIHFMERHHLLWTEQAREVALLIILVVVAYMAGSHFKEKAGAFLFTVGIWNLAYYTLLYLLIRWPPTLAAWDAHIVIPRPVPMPIYASVIASLAFLMLSVFLLKSPAGGGGGKSKGASKSKGENKK